MALPPLRLPPGGGALPARYAHLLPILVALAVLLAVIEGACGFAANNFLHSLSSALSYRREGHTAAMLPPSIFTAIGLFMALAMRGIVHWICTFIPIVIGDGVSLSHRKQIVDAIFGSGNYRNEATTSVFLHGLEKAGYSARFAVSFWRDVAVFTVLFAGAVYLSWELTFYVLLTLLVFVIPLRYLQRYLSRLAEQSHVSWGHASRRFVRSLANLMFIRLCGTARREGARAKQDLESSYSDLVRVHRGQGLGYAYLQVCGGVLVLVVGALIPSVEYAEFFTPIGYLYLIGRLLDRGMQIQANYTEFLIYRPYAELAELHLMELRSRKYDGTEIASPPVRVVALNAPLGWSLKDVSFAYQSEELFDSLTLDIPAGALVVIHGPSGSGKSTFLKLLLGLVTPHQGQIEVTSGDKRFTVPERAEDIYQSIGYVSSDSFLIPGSIRENLLYGSHRSPSDEEMYDALRAANCQFVTAGLDHPIDDDSNALSMGERQRLAFARALLRKPRALIVDEGMSNLDIENELWILLHLASLTNILTVIVVSHRPTIRDFADYEIELERREEGVVVRSSRLVRRGDTVSASRGVSSV